MDIGLATSDSDSHEAARSRDGWMSVAVTLVMRRSLRAGRSGEVCGEFMPLNVRPVP